MKIAVITCYDQVESHVRPRVLRRGFADCDGVETIIVKNSKKSLLRYLEVPYKILLARFTKRPDAYVITFRGYEMLPFVLLIKGRKPVIFDEMVNAVEYLHEHKKLKPGSRADKLFSSFYGRLLKRCRFILADTDAHADLSAKLCNVDRSRYVTVPISTDESVFFPAKKDGSPVREGFNVFFYAVMVKLHGLEYMLEAAVELCKKYPDITFTLGGDSGKAVPAYEAAIAKGARITYHSYYALDEVPAFARAANLCVGGPFGGTPQSQLVITTKTFQFLASALPVLVGRNKVNLALEDKVNSLVVPQKDTQALIDTISWAYEHPKELDRIGKAGRKLYEQQFSQAIIGKRLQKLVKEL